MSSALLLLADSQLFFREQSAPQLHSLMRQRFPAAVDAAYIGAANGNEAAYYELACQALDTLTGRKNNIAFVADLADLPSEPCSLVILAGGSVGLGWEFISKPPVWDWLHRCHHSPDSLMIGVSAGALHMAGGLDPERPGQGRQTFLGWLPFDIAVHEEHQSWPSLIRPPALGIPMGGGIWVEGRPDQQSLRSLGSQCFTVAVSGIRQTIANLEHPDQQAHPGDEN